MNTVTTRMPVSSSCRATLPASSAVIRSRPWNTSASASSNDRNPRQGQPRIQRGPWLASATLIS
jgi:hypothetical protein